MVIIDPSKPSNAGRAERRLHGADLCPARFTSLGSSRVDMHAANFDVVS